MQASTGRGSRAEPTKDLHSFVSLNSEERHSKGDFEIRPLHFPTEGEYRPTPLQYEDEVLFKGIKDTKPTGSDESFNLGDNRTAPPTLLEQQTLNSPPERDITSDITHG
uniref:Uncharacterized protein n=1 Tax=Physcomitrium patens TaxID=3218 RepID=A0A2K1K7F1_PHYPA|nr:hypothetical protein PHYPA_011599 [Physcomitrium patens]